MCFPYLISVLTSDNSFFHFLFITLYSLDLALKEVCFYLPLIHQFLLFKIFSRDCHFWLPTNSGVTSLLYFLQETGLFRSLRASEGITLRQRDTEWSIRQRSLSDYALHAFVIWFQMLIIHIDVSFNYCL